MINTYLYCSTIFLSFYILNPELIRSLRFAEKPYTIIRTTFISLPQVLRGVMVAILAVLLFKAYLYLRTLRNDSKFLFIFHKTFNLTKTSSEGMNDCRYMVMLKCIMHN